MVGKWEHADVPICPSVCCVMGRLVDISIGNKKGALKIPYVRRVYKSVDNISIFQVISQKWTETKIEAR